MRSYGRLRRLLAARANGTVLVLQVLLASFIALRGYAATQDGPVHLYAAHVLGALRDDPRSPYARFFVSNLHPAGNSLFTYVARAAGRFLSPEHIAELVSFGALLLLPASVVAFERALRRSAALEARECLPPVSATALACLLAYNYFFYRGLFNYVLAVPLALLCLAATLATGDPERSRFSALGVGVGAVALATLTALAHPAAAVFLLAAVPCACVRAPRPSRVAGGAVLAVLLVLSTASRIRGEGPLSVRFSDPVSASWMFVRALGITHTWFEVIPAAALAGCLLVAGGRVIRLLRRKPVPWVVVWPGALALGLFMAYFFVPFELGGAAGLNERIPLFVAALLLPFVPLSEASRKGLVSFAILFSVYTAAASVPRDLCTSRTRALEAASLVPPGSVVYAVPLAVKLGSLSADLGRHLLADVARRRDLVSGDVFCSHPAHVIRCLSAVPPSFDPSAVQGFEHLGERDQREALTDPRSSLRQSFARAVRDAAAADYLLVLGAPLLDAAFQRYVVSPLHATLLDRQNGAVRAYRLPTTPRRESP